MAKMKKKKKKGRGGMMYKSCPSYGEVSTIRV